MPVIKTKRTYRKPHMQLTRHKKKTFRILPYAVLYNCENDINRT